MFLFTSILVKHPQPHMDIHYMLIPLQHYHISGLKASFLLNRLHRIIVLFLFFLLVGQSVFFFATTFNSQSKLLEVGWLSRRRKKSPRKVKRQNENANATYRYRECLYGYTVVFVFSVVFRGTKEKYMDCRKS